MTSTDNGVAQDQRLVRTLGDAAMGALYTALLLAALMYVSWLIFLAARVPLLSMTAGMWGVSEETVSILWIAAVALLKLIALSFAAVAFGLWVWRRRVVRRMGHSVREG